jgi:hypothetical protein
MFVKDAWGVTNNLGVTDDRGIRVNCLVEDTESCVTTEIQKIGSQDRQWGGS